MGRGLLPEAVDYLQRGMVHYDVDFLAQFHLGLLYLYGQDKDGDVIDIPSAEHHFRLSARYARSLLSELDEARRYCGEALFHASVACYAQAGEFRRAGDLTTAQAKIREAIDLAIDSVGVYGELNEARYHLGKYHAQAGDADRVVAPLREAVQEDHQYLLKVSVDPDFDDARAEVDSFAESMRQEIGTFFQMVITNLESWLGEIEDVLASGAWDEYSSERIVAEMRGRIGKLEQTAEGGTYLDHYHALLELEDMWDGNLADMLRRTIGQELSRHIVDVTGPLLVAHPHLEHGAFSRTIPLWPANFLEEQRRKFVVECYPKAREFINTLPEDRPGYTNRLEELANRVQSLSPRDVLSANNLLRDLLEDCKELCDTYYQKSTVLAAWEEEQATERQRQRHEQASNAGTFVGAGCSLWIVSIVLAIISAVVGGIFGDDSVINAIIVFIGGSMVIVGFGLMLWGAGRWLFVRMATPRADSGVSRANATSIRVGRQESRTRSAYLAAVRTLRE